MPLAFDVGIQVLLAEDGDLAKLAPEVDDASVLPTLVQEHRISAVSSELLTQPRIIELAAEVFRCHFLKIQILLSRRPFKGNNLNELS